MQQLQKKYGLITAICMVIGSVIGSGVFFKAEAISRITGGSGGLGIIAWIAGGAVMLVCLMMFAMFAARFEDAGGIVDYAERTVGERYSYYLGWFMATIYYPTLVSVLAWLSARYTLLFLGSGNSSGGLCMLLASIYLVVSFAQNAFLPAFSGKFQIAATIIKLIPLVLMIVLGSLSGLKTGILAQNFPPVELSGAASTTLFSAIVASAFAYEGWIAATSINAELKNSKRNLPLALLIGGSAITVIYILYYVGICGAVNGEILINYPSDGIRMAFDAVLGKSLGAMLTAFVAVSCLGALNGLMLGCGRAMYAAVQKGRGPAPKVFSRIDDATGMPLASCAIGLVLSMGWLLFYYGARISETPLFGTFGFDSSELPIVTIYAMYIPMFFMYMKKYKERSAIKRFAIPILGIGACVFMIFSALDAHKGDIVDYLAAFSAIMLFGNVFENKREE